MANNGGHRVYKIPYNLSSSVFDIELSIFNNFGRSKRQVTLRTLLIFSVGALIYIGLMTNSFIGNGGFLGITIFTIGYFWFLVQLCMPTLTKQIGLNLFLPMFNYISKDKRYIPTRQTNLIKPIQDIIGIQGIEPETAKVIFSNGEVGLVYEVVGNASYLMFDADVRKVLSDANRFYKQVSPKVSITYDFAVEPQRVYKQVSSAIQLKRDLRVESEGLQSLLNNQINFLTTQFGSTFKSYHQYMVVRAKNDEALLDFEELLQRQVAGSFDFIADYQELNEEETLAYFKDVYTEPPSYREILKDLKRQSKELDKLQ